MLRLDQLRRTVWASMSDLRSLGAICNAKWTKEEQYLKQLMSLFSRSPSQQTLHSTDVGVPQIFVDLWECMRDLTASHNVIFESSDGEVAANEHILTVASPVLKAVLESAMTEGRKSLPLRSHSWPFKR